MGPVQSPMKTSIRWLLQVLVTCLIILIVGIFAWCLALYASNGSLHVCCGLLPTAKDEYLDNSGRVFQSLSWHFGNARRTWGETYGLKISRAYLSVQVTHVNPSISGEEANE